MKKFLERSLQKLRQDNIERKKKQMFDELVQKQKDKVRIEFFAATQASERDFTKDNQADAVKFINVLNMIQNENSSKVQKRHELEEQIEELDKLEALEAHSKSCISEQNRKDIVNWSVNLSPEKFNKLTLEMAGQYNEQTRAFDPDYLAERLQFLADKLEGIQIQQTKEQQITSALETRINMLDEEQQILTKRYNEAKQVQEMMEHCLTDMEKLQHTAKNKLLRTTNNLHLLKTELKAADAEGQEYIGRLTDDLEGTHAVSRVAEDVFSKLMVKIDEAKKAKQELEEKYKDLRAKEKVTVQKLLDAEMTIKYVDIFTYLERRYVSKSIPPGSEFEFSQDNSSKRSQSESPRKKLFKDLLLSSEDSSASPGRRRISSIDRDSPNASFRQGRLSEIGQANRDGILKKMFYFCERHNLDVLVDQLASIHRIMLSTEFRLKEAYEKASTEKTKKEETLKALTDDLYNMIRITENLGEHEKVIEAAKEDDDMKVDPNSLPTTNQMDFTFKELLPILNEELRHKKPESFLVVAYAYLIHTMSRISKLCQVISGKSHKVSYAVVYAFEDVNKYLVETLHVSLGSLMRSNITFAIRRKERTSTGIMEFLGRKRHGEEEEEGQEEKENGKSELPFQQKLPLNKPSKPPVYYDKKDFYEEKIDELLEKKSQIQTLTRYQIINYFEEIFPNSTENAEQWADLIFTDQIALLVASKENIQEYLKMKLADYGVQLGAEKAISCIKEFKQKVRDILQDRFVGMLRRFDRLMTSLKENKLSNHKLFSLHVK